MTPQDIERLKAATKEIGVAFNNLGPEMLLRIALDLERNAQLQQINDKLESLLIEFTNLSYTIRNRS
jgi:hypothetical protein